MNAYYAAAGLSKQSHWQWQQRESVRLDKWLLLESVLTDWRTRHPAMGLKKLYHCVRPNFVGVNSFIDYCIANGFEATSYRKKPRTSDSDKEKVTYPNLLIDAVLCDINQVWVSDTTYFRIAEQWYYITFVMDLYSRRILGYHAADTLLAKAHLVALRMAFDLRGIAQFNYKLMHHSDRGSQYQSQLYTQALEQKQLRISMGKIVYDNIHVERLHQTIKGEYLIHQDINNKKQLRFHLKKDVGLYNSERPHEALKLMTPLEFEQHIKSISLHERPLMKVWALKTKSKKQPKDNPKQLKLPF